MCVCLDLHAHNVLFLGFIQRGGDAVGVCGLLAIQTVLHSLNG